MPAQIFLFSQVGKSTDSSSGAMTTTCLSLCCLSVCDRTETFGQVVQEALASGLPVVGLRAERVCDLVQHNTTGKLNYPG